MEGHSSLGAPRSNVKGSFVIEKLGLRGGNESVIGVSEQRRKALGHGRGGGKGSTVVKVH